MISSDKKTKQHWLYFLLQFLLFLSSLYILKCLQLPFVEPNGYYKNQNTIRMHSKYQGLPSVMCGTKFTRVRYFSVIGGLIGLNEEIRVRNRQGD